MTTSMLADALLKAVNGARVDAVDVLGRRHRVDFHAPVPMVTTNLSASEVFAASIARVSRGVFADVVVHPVSAAVYRVEAMEVPAPPARVFILSAVFGGTLSGHETVGVYATRALAEEAAAGHHMPHIEEASVQTRALGDPRTFVAAEAAKSPNRAEDEHPTFEVQS